MFFSYTYDFTYSYPLNDNNWHSIVLAYNQGPVWLFLDRVRHHMENHIGRNSYNFAGEVRLGYYQDNSGTEHYFEGSIGSVDLYKDSYSAPLITAYITGRCIPARTGLWDKVWKGYQMASIPVQDCDSRSMYICISLNLEKVLSRYSGFIEINA